MLLYSKKLFPEWFWIISVMCGTCLYQWINWPLAQLLWYQYNFAYFTGIKACIQENYPVNEEPYEVSLDNHGCIGGPKAGRLRASSSVSLFLLVFLLVIRNAFTMLCLCTSCLLIFLVMRCMKFKSLYNMPSVVPWVGFGEDRVYLDLIRTW